MPCRKNSWLLLCRPSRSFYKGSKASSCLEFSHYSKNNSATLFIMYFVIGFAFVLLSGAVATQPAVDAPTAVQVRHSISFSFSFLRPYLDKPSETSLTSVLLLQPPRNVTLLRFGPTAQLRTEVHSRQPALIPRNRTRILQN